MSSRVTADAVVRGRAGRGRAIGLALLVLLTCACGPRVDAPAPGVTIPAATPGVALPGGGTGPPATAPAQPAAASTDAAAGTGPGAAPEGGVPAPGAVPPAGDPPPPAAPDGPAPPVEGPAPAASPAVAMPPLDAPLGSLCRTYLRPGPDRIVVEVDAQAGAALPAGVLAHLRDSLAAVTTAPVELVDGGGVAGGAEPWTLDRVRQVAAATRDAAHGDRTAVIHVLSLAGQPDQAEPPPGQADIRSAIGVAFAAGEFVVFPDRVDGLSALLGGAEPVLRAVALHEAGHLLCLVGLTYDSELDHEDPAHPGHSADRGSVMFHAIETTAVGQLFTGPPPDAFAPADLADLAALREGRY